MICTATTTKSHPTEGLVNEQDRKWLEGLADGGLSEAKRILAHLNYLEQEAYRAQERERKLIADISS